MIAEEKTLSILKYPNQRQTQQTPFQGATQREQQSLTVTAAPSRARGARQHLPQRCWTRCWMEGLKEQITMMNCVSRVRPLLSCQQGHLLVPYSCSCSSFPSHFYNIVRNPYSRVMGLLPPSAVCVGLNTRAQPLPSIRSSTQMSQGLGLLFAKTKPCGDLTKDNIPATDAPIF